ncbi:hypothetical protein A6046_00970 [[Haemophilus] ducreyi]|uniref:Uncharacterized protein n=2 Tax=Haemophilus ducreyi TaxID=730 RepID=Q7VMM8_HAEDU|nr:hypothetical protein [[Haemophilus] ducreyi]AAP95828.1 hypothetical protein HD_0946 [[Haemophilus] ducreyi 35000HP]AKO30860.1 hypothetical protein RY60_03740 [[Haemophilus] ducreyi]AKO32298.1 hypothetical protein RZ57_03745 [[Haemophilus] ducreyi]AKO33752.1 hypothetical protein RZ58_03760 [[Haemophilus] ducreyi]AKO35200.1 hypothetical protein RZ59_03725 [[Haemophilus] ducreyi]
MNLNLELLQFIWKNRHKAGFFTIVLRKVYHAGKCRQFSVYIQKNGKFVDVSRLVANISGNKTATRYDCDFVVIPGCGMDMAYSMLYQFLDNLSIRLKKRQHAYHCKAANQYILL